MKIVVLGASGLTGQRVVTRAIEKGFDVTAYVRHAGSMPKHERLKLIQGELSDLDALESAFQGADAILCCLGTRSMRFAKDVSLMQESVRFIVSGMQKSNVTRIILLSAFGVGETAPLASSLARIIYNVAVKAIYRDKELAENALVRTALKWTILYPVGLTNGPLQADVDARPISEVRKIPGVPTVPRANVARVMIDAVENDQTTGQRIVVTRKGSAR